MDRVHELESPIRHYAWGSHTFLAELQGRSAPTAEPEAELWMGAHSSAPSLVVSGDERVPLDRWIARDPERMLGSAVAGRFDRELPFLLKILAVEAPLSVQVHPDAEQARAGFEREQAAGLALDAEERCYRDRRPKPEAIHALTPFEALVGLRPASEALADLASLEARELDPLMAALREQPDAEGMRRAWSRLLAWRRDVPAWLPGLVDALGRRARSRDAASRVARLAEAWPGDPAVLAPYFLNAVTLSPGESLFVGPGTVHAYLRGAVVEIQANSDNVLRAGLTGKHVDPDELLRIARFEPDDPRPAKADDWPPVEAFRLEARQVDGACELAGGVVRIVACTEGSLEVSSAAAERVRLGPGSACFIPASAAGCRLAGRGRVFEAAPGRLDP